MKRILSLFLVIISLCSCAKADRWLVWRGEKEIPKDGGTVVWKPIKDTRVYPDIRALFFYLYDSEGIRVKYEELKDTQGDWYVVKTSMNTISISLSANDSEYTRNLVVAFADGVTTGGHAITIRQSN